MLDQIDAALSLLDRFQRWRERNATPVEESVQARFVRLFEAHGVHRNQIPRFFGHGLSLADVRDDAALSEKLTGEHLATASTLFGVQLEWLESGRGPAQERLNFYKHPEEFWVWLADVSTRAKREQRFLQGLMVLPKGGFTDMEAVLLIAEPIGSLDDERIERIHWVAGGPPDYWRCRGFLASYVAAADSHDVILRARRMGNSEMTKRITDADLIGSKTLSSLRSYKDSVETLKWLEDPSAFLSGVDPEQNSFGVRAALSLWLDLESRGLMRSASPRPTPRHLFEESLRRLG